MQASASNSGISVVGDLAWGSHFCHFYESDDDLRDSILAYFQAGLASRQRCLWMTSAPLCAEDARSMLAAAIPELDRHLSSGQVEIIDRDAFIARGNDLDDCEDRALAVGYAGLRVAGRACVPGGAPKKRGLALCTYPLSLADGHRVLEVVQNHDFALIRRQGIWEQIDNASVRAKALETALMDRADVMSSAAHELKTPLTSLQLYVEGLLRLMRREDFDVVEGSRRLERALEQCNRLNRVINNLCEVVRVRDQREEVRPQPFDLPALVRSIGERPPRRANVFPELVLDLPTKLGCITDPARVERALTNLIENATKCAPGSAVYITVTPKALDRVLISVRDDGGETDATNPGLCVWVARQVVDTLAGTLRVASTSGAGTEIEIELPRFIRLEDPT